MFEKIIKDLKKNLPGALGKKAGKGEVDLDEDLEESEELNANSDDSSDASDDKNKKRNSMILRVLIILGLGYFALDEFVLKDQSSSDESVEALLAKAPVRKKRVRPAENVATTETPTTEAVPPADVSDPQAIEATPPIENVNVLDKDAPEVSAPVEASAPIMEAPKVEDEVISQTPVTEPSLDKRIDQLIDSADQASASQEEIMIPSQPRASESPREEPASMASKIVEEVSQTAPPAYDQVGRGLVYNCKDKYWACLDKPAYVICNKNMKWNKSKGNSAECVVQDIYSSEEDCAKVQKYNVSTNLSTGFCQN